LSFGEPETNETMSLDKVFENDGSGEKPLYITMNSKVIEAALDRNSTEFDMFRALTQQMGQVGEIVMSKIAYDPKYGSPASLEEVTPEHAAYCEHNFCAYLKMQGTLDHWKAIAHLQLPSDSPPRG
jgi:hypothetical protein